MSLPKVKILTSNPNIDWCRYYGTKEDCQLQNIYLTPKILYSDGIINDIKTEIMSFLKLPKTPLKEPCRNNTKDFINVGSRNSTNLSNVFGN